MSDILYLGVDPGLTGAVAILDPKGGIVEIYDLETLEIAKKSKGGKTRNVLNGSALYDYLHNWMARNPGTRFFATLENQQAFPGITNKAIPACPACGQVKKKAEGVVSSFRSGETFGTIKAVINIALGIPMQIAYPAGWKRKFILIGKSKEDSRLQAINLWPEQSSQFKLKKHHNRAEACLIGLYGIEHKWAGRLG